MCAKLARIATLPNAQRTRSPHFSRYLETMGEAISAWWPGVGSLLSVLVALSASVHVVLHKRDVRSAAGWFGLVWLAPVVGPVLYFLLGINRVRRRAVARRRGALREQLTADNEHTAHISSGQSLVSGHLAELSGAIHRVTERPLLGGNQVEPLWTATGLSRHAGCHRFRRSNRSLCVRISSKLTVSVACSSKPSPVPSNVAWPCVC